MVRICHKFDYIDETVSTIVLFIFQHRLLKLKKVHRTFKGLS